VICCRSINRPHRKRIVLITARHLLLLLPLPPWQQQRKSYRSNHQKHRQQTGRNGQARYGPIPYHDEHGPRTPAGAAEAAPQLGHDEPRESVRMDEQGQER
jgi:hypothetical protein